jgi:hypothetical protein
MWSAVRTLQCQLAEAGVVSRKRHERSS